MCRHRLRCLYLGEDFFKDFLFYICNFAFPRTLPACKWEILMFAPDTGGMKGCTVCLPSTASGWMRSGQVPVQLTQVFVSSELHSQNWCLHFVHGKKRIPIKQIRTRVRVQSLSSRSCYIRIHSAAIHSFGSIFYRATNRAASIFTTA